MKKEKKTDNPSYPGSVPMVRIDGAKIRQLRENQKLTQLYISTVVGVTTDTISRWENKHYQSIKLENAEKLAQALEVSFEDILKQDEQTNPEPQDPDIQPQKQGYTEQPGYPKRTVILSILLISVISGITLYAIFSQQPQITVSAQRILPPHVSPGQDFPVLIRVLSPDKTPVSLIIKELIPHGALVQQGLPAITNIDHKENSLKWIRRIDSSESVYAYLCQVPEQILQGDQLIFNGTITLKNNVGARQTIEGTSSLTIAPFHWADSNKDYMIDDEEILAVYDTYSDIGDLPFNLELIDSIWASNSYAWDSTKKKYTPID
jgi:transcriptional regulator with XRE-family HTH domain